jgi:threonine aldolase
MRRAIYEAEVGNSAYGEDPSVNALEQAMAEFFEREAALFFPSATMAGQSAIAVWCRPAEGVLIEEYGHNHYFETGSMPLISGTQAVPLKGDKGILSAEVISNATRHVENPEARVGLIILENTSNYGGGTVYPLTNLDQIFEVANYNSLPVHIDGARIFNAIQYYRQTADSVPPGQLIPPRGSMSVCFSKGMGAPMGAVLLGDQDFINEATRIRQLLGGGMRQVGFMAAAALYGFQYNVDRLIEDHANARLLAEGLAQIDGLTVDLTTVQTNMVYVDVADGTDRAEQLISQLENRGIRAWNLGPKLRFVTSMLVDESGCGRALQATAEAMKDA